jgi:hypothetical protein
MAFPKLYSSIYLNMKLHEEVLRIRELLGEKKEQKIFRVPGLDFFHEDPWEAWQILQKILEQRGNPPYTIGGDLRRTPIKSLGNLISVEGDLGLSNTPIESLGNLISVGGNLDLSNTPIESLGNLESVGGNLNLEYTPIKSLGNLTSVGGDLKLTDTPIKSLGNLISVGDDLYLYDTPLSEEYTEEEIRQMVDVGGHIYL